MAVEIANAILNITPSLAGLSREIDRQMRGVDSRRAGADIGEGFTSGFKGVAAKLTGIIAGAFAAVKIKDFATGAINQASDMAEVGTKLQAIYGDAASDIEAFGAQGAKALGQTSLQAKNAAATFGTFGKAAGLSGKENAAFSTGLAKLATDMASFSNTTPEQAIEALGAGLRGESEPLRAYGVLLDDASLRNEALAMGLITTTKDALTPQQKVLASHALIMKQTSDAQGDFARTSGGLANQQRILSASWEDAKGKLGTAFLPAVTGVVAAFNERLFPVLDNALTKIPEFTEKVGAAWELLTTGEFAGTSAGLGEEDSPLVSALFGARDAYFTVKGVLDEAWSILSRGDFQGGNGLEEDSPIVSFLFTLREFGLDTFDRLRGIWDKLWAVGEKLWPHIQSIAESLGQAFATLSENGLTLWDGLFVVFDKIADVMNDYLVPAFEWLARFMRENPASVLTFVGVIGAVIAAVKLWAIAQAALNLILTANPIGLIVVALAAFAAAVVWAYNNVEWFRDLVDGAWNVISTATSWAWENVIKPVLGYLWDRIRDLGGSFSTLWDTVSNVWSWIQDKVSTVWNWLRDYVFTPLALKIQETGQFFSDLWTTVQDVWTWISDKVSTVWNWINQNVFAPMMLGINTIGTFFSNLWTTVQDVWNKVGSFFTGIAEGIKTAVANVKQGIEDVKALITGLGATLGSEGADLGNGAKLNFQLDGPAGGIQDIGKFFGWWSDGGVLPGYQPGVDTEPAMLSKGEGILRPEVVRAVGPAWIYAANAAAKSGQGIPGFAAGGVVGGGAIGGLGGLIGYDVYLKAMNQVAGMVGKKFEELKPTGGGGYQSNGNWGPVNMSGFAENTAAAKAFIEANFSGVSSIGGLYGGSVSGSDHPYGKALDVMIANYASAQGIAAGTTIADWFRTNVDAFGSKYVIWRDQIDNLRGTGWEPYSHPGGNNDTLAHRDHVHLSFLTGNAGFQGGPIAGDTASMLGLAAAGGGSGVERWRGLGLDVLAKVGAYRGMNLLPFIGNMMNQIRTESGGDPNAINNYDINAQRGDPSIGLLQVIGSTFRSALRGTPFEGLIGAGQRDPRASLTASTLYSLNRYGSLDRAWRGVAYAKGGIVPDFGGGTDSVRGWLTPGEGVFTQPQTDAIITHARALEAGYAGMVPHVQVFIGETELTDIVDVRVSNQRIAANRQLASDLSVARGLA